MSNRDLLSLSDAAKRYRVPVPTLRNAVQRGLLPGEKIGSQWVVRAEHVEQYVSHRPRRGRPSKKKD